MGDRKQPTPVPVGAVKPPPPPAPPRKQAFGIEPLGGGMTLRDYFAGHALASFAANETAGKLLNSDRQRLAAVCYQLADCMIAEREK